MTVVEPGKDDDDDDDAYACFLFLGIALPAFLRQPANHKSYNNSSLIDRISQCDFCFHTLYSYIFSFSFSFILVFIIFRSSFTFCIAMFAIATNSLSQTDRQMAVSCQ